MRASRKDSPAAPDFVKRLVLWGIGPRGGQSLIQASKARAALNGRQEVALEDVQARATPVLRHRLVLNYTIEAEGEDSDSIIAKLIDHVPAHKSKSARNKDVQRVFAA